MASHEIKPIRFKKGASAAKDINVTPLIDIVLVLLIIFMVGSAIPIHEMEPSLPDRVDTVDQQDMPDQLIAAVYEDGSIALNLQPVTLEELKDQVYKRLMRQAVKVVFVDAHPDANYARVVQVMDTVRDAGAEKVGIASLKDEGPARPGSAPAAPGGAAAPGTPAPPTPPTPPTPPRTP